MKHEAEDGARRSDYTGNPNTASETVKNGMPGTYRTKPLFRAVRNTALIFLLISLVTSKYGIFASFCAGCPTVLPAAICPRKESFGIRIAKSVLWGTAGVAVSVLFMLLTGSYETRRWLVPAAAGVMLCILYGPLCRSLPAKREMLAKSAVLIGEMVICFM